MNELERLAGEIVADHLHRKDPRFVWTPRPAATRKTRPAVVEGRRAA